MLVGVGTQSAWLGIVVPALAPIFLCTSRHHMATAQLRPDAVVGFALPFVMALSLCYLSVYTPMRAAWYSYGHAAAGLMLGYGRAAACL